MRAILVLAGRLLEVFALERNGRSEVVGFLTTQDDPATSSYVRGFLAIIKHMADNGVHQLTPEMRKCWRQDGTQVCELKKGPWRISFFILGDNRILLTTLFRKTKSQQRQEYARAIRYFNGFRANPVF